MLLRKGTSKVIIFGPFLDKTDGVTLETGMISAIDHATTGIMVSKDGGALALRNGTPTASTYSAHGCYRVVLDSTDTNTAGVLRVIYTGPTGLEVCLPVWKDYLVVEGAVFDAFVFGPALDNFDVNVTQWNGTAVATPDTAGHPKVTIKSGAGTGEISLSGGVVSNVAAVGTVTTVNGLAAGVITAASIAADAITAAKVADGTIDALTFAAGAIDAAAIAADAITAAKVASDVSAEIADAVWDEDATGHQVLGSFGQAIGDPVADTNTIYKAVVTDAAGATVGVDVVAVQADTDNIQTRIPAALVSGRIDASVGAMAASVLTASAIAADAITAAKIADGAIDAATFAASAITATAIATDAITAAKIAADAIGASELAADAVTEIQSGLATSAALVTAQTDLDNIQTRLPAALIGGRMDSDVEAINNNTEAADDLQFAGATIVRGTASGVPTTTSIPASDLVSTVNEHYKGRTLIFTSGVLADQATSISAYVGATKTLTVVAVTSAPAAGTSFIIV